MIECNDKCVFYFGSLEKKKNKTQNCVSSFLKWKPIVFSLVGGNFRKYRETQELRMNTHEKSNIYPFFVNVSFSECFSSVRNANGFKRTLETVNLNGTCIDMLMPRLKSNDCKKMITPMTTHLWVSLSFPSLTLKPKRNGQ